MFGNLDHSKNIIEIKDVFFSYSGEEKNDVLTKINLNVHQGDYLGIIGPNGGGKTTLIKLILGLLKPQRGTIKMFGKNIADFKDWPKIGYVPQKATSFDNNFPATVGEVVMMGRYPHLGLFRWPGKEDKTAVKTALGYVDMEDFQNRLIGNLSGGQQQRVLIARALAAEPEVIFLDEPTAGVDLETQEKFYKLLQKLNGELGITLVVISHDIDVVAHEVTELAFINKELIYENNPKEFLKNSALNKLYGHSVKIIEHNYHNH